MTNATKSLVTIFLVITAVALVIELNSGQEASQAFQSEILSVDTVRIDRMVIEAPSRNKPIQLFREEGEWKVSRQDGPAYAADPQAIRETIDQLNNLQVNALVTRDSEDYTRYKVDSTGTRVTFRRGDQVTDRVIVGAPQFISRSEINSYVRPTDREEVYSVEGYLKPRLDKSVNDWRDKTVWNIPGEQIARVDFMFPADSSYSIERVGENSFVSNGDSLQSTKIRPILNQLGGLEATGFVEQLEKQDFGREQFAVQLQLENGEQRKLRFKEDPEDTNRYQVVAGDYPYVFTLTKRTWQEQVFKSRSELRE